MTGRASAYRLATRLGPRDINILISLHEFRLMTGRQLRILHFPGGEPSTQARKTRAALRRLTELGVITRTERRVGGVRSGSEGYVYGLSGLGHAVLDLDAPEPRRHRGVAETKSAFAAHVLGVADLGVQLYEQARAGTYVIKELRTEPGCWRWFTSASGTRRALKPDAYIRLSADGLEMAAFLELDMATESLPTIFAKCGVYLDYWRTGSEQCATGFFPRIWWLVPHAERLAAISQTILRLTTAEQRLFAVALTADAVGALTKPLTTTPKEVSQ